MGSWWFVVGFFPPTTRNQQHTTYNVQRTTDNDMSRSAKKGPYVDEKLYQKVLKLNQMKAKQPVKTWARACTIIPEFVGHTFEVHNGNKFHRVFVQEDMVGHKLGEFSPTRTFRGHSGRKATAPGAA